jgi:NADPH:quinone reductase-like Zn-dependent oxidoreductase
VRGISLGCLKSNQPSPYVLGFDGAGTIAAIGKKVTNLQEGDDVYAASYLNPKGGFYAQYIVVKATNVSLIPKKLTMDQAGAMPVVALTALRGLQDIIGLKEGESVLIFGAGGGVGHMAVQLAKRLGARVFAVALGEDGVALAQRLGADAVAEGHQADVVAAIREFAPHGLDAALFTAGGEVAEGVLNTVRDNGRVAHPFGAMLSSKAHPNLNIQAFDGMSYDGTLDPARPKKLNQLIELGPFEVHVAHTFPLTRAADAHRMLESHFLGKLVLGIED